MRVPVVLGALAVRRQNIKKKRLRKCYEIHEEKFK